MAEWKKLKKVDKECFACGDENNHGLKMSFESNGEQLRSNIVIPSHLRGWSSLAHGGVLATILDETMSWTAIHLFNKFILTQKIEIEYKRPVYIESNLISFGWVNKIMNSRKAVLEAEIRDEENKICASSKGTFVLFEKDEFRKKNIVSKDLLDGMDKIFG